LKKGLKILFSIPLIIGILIFLQLAFPVTFACLHSKPFVFFVWAIGFDLILATCLIILIKRIWAYEAVSKSKKKRWTWLLIIYHCFAITIYVWRIDDQLIKENLLQNNTD
jgi:Mn2+/Fe2+ NRAMP family transporter